MDEWMGGWVDGWVDGWMDGWIDVTTALPIHSSMCMWIVFLPWVL